MFKRKGEKSLIMNSSSPLNGSHSSCCKFCPEDPCTNKEPWYSTNTLEKGVSMLNTTSMIFSSTSALSLGPSFSDDVRNFCTIALVENAAALTGSLYGFFSNSHYNNCVYVTNIALASLNGIACITLLALN